MNFRLLRILVELEQLSLGCRFHEMSIMAESHRMLTRGLGR